MPGFTRWLCIVIAMLMLPATASAATKKPRFYRLGAAGGAAVTGKSDVALPINESSVAFINFGTQPPTETLLSVPPCRQFLASPDTLVSHLAAAGRGQVLWTCNSDGPPLLEDVTTGEVTNVLDLPPVLQPADGGQPFDASIGKDWIGTKVEDRGGYFLAYFNPTSYLWLGELKSPRNYANLDDPDLVETMCRPLHRTPFPADLSDEGPYFQPYFYDHRYGVGTLDHVQNRLVTEDITVQRCGSRKVLVVEHCGIFCEDVQYSDGLLTWMDRYALRAYAPRTGKRYSWPLSAFSASSDLNVSFAHTRQRLVASIGPPPGSHDWTIWTASLPRH